VPNANFSYYIYTFVNSVSRNQLLAVVNYKHLQMY